MRSYTVLGLCFLAGLLVGHTLGVEIASFNIQYLGKTKMSRPNVVAVLKMVSATIMVIAAAGRFADKPFLSLFTPHFSFMNYAYLGGGSKR